MAKLKSRIFIPLFCMLASTVSAQTVTPEKPKLFKFNHLEVGVGAGSTGVGLNLTMPVTDNVDVRAGFDYSPRFIVPMTFNLMSYSGLDDNESETTKFDRLSELMEDMTGFKVDRKVNMNAKGTIFDFKLMFDIYPLRNKHFYGTVGCYWGTSRIGHIENTLAEAPSLMGVMMYNRYYDFFHNERYLYEPFVAIGNMGMIDPDLGDIVKQKFDSYGKVGALMGQFDNGQPYMMQPDIDGTVHADMYVHSFKPYLGVGYTTNLSKDKRWNLGVDVGALFWGKPRINTHEHYVLDAQGKNYTVDNDGNKTYNYMAYNPEDKETVYGAAIDLARDVRDVRGKVGDYVDFASSMHVWPVLNLRITYKLF